MSGLLCKILAHWFRIGNATALSASVILYYDYLLTLPMEIDRFWCKGSHTWASTIFLVNRYAALLGHVPFFYITFVDPCQLKHIVAYHGILVILLTTLTMILLVMRVYALYYQNKWILYLVVLELIAGILVACWTLSRLLPVAITDTTRRTHLQAAAFSGLLVFDSTIFALTMARSIRLWSESRNRKDSLLRRLFIDGVLYYAVIGTLNIVNIFVLFFTPPRINLSTPTFTNILLVVMISRLMINLRDPTLQRSADSDGTVTTSHDEDVNVSTFVLNEIPFTTRGTQAEPESNQ